MRGHWLRQIELALKGRGIVADIRSVADLRRLFPRLPSPLSNAALERLASDFATADLSPWRAESSKNGDRPRARRSLISYEEIKARQAAGETLASIALVAGLSRERIRQICKK